jgi:hypothetical protein
MLICGEPSIAAGSSDEVSVGTMLGAKPMKGKLK